MSPSGPSPRSPKRKFDESQAGSLMDATLGAPPPYEPPAYAEAVGVQQPEKKEDIDRFPHPPGYSTQGQGEWPKNEKKKDAGGWPVMFDANQNGDWWPELEEQLAGEKPKQEMREMKERSQGVSSIVPGKEEESEAKTVDDAMDVSTPEAAQER